MATDPGSRQIPRAKPGGSSKKKCKKLIILTTILPYNLSMHPISSLSSQLIQKESEIKELRIIVEKIFVSQTILEIKLTNLTK